MSTASTAAERQRGAPDAALLIPRGQALTIAIAALAAGVICLAIGSPGAAVTIPLAAVASLIDWHTGRLIDRLTLPSLAAALFIAALCGAPGAAAMGAAVGLAGGSLLALLRPLSAGFGDAKLLGALGAASDPQTLAAGVAIACVAALPVALRRRGRPIPMGPFFTSGVFAAIVLVSRAR